MIAIARPTLKMVNNELLESYPFRYLSEPDEIIHLNGVASGLLELFYLCIETSESIVALTWPVRIENSAILHALAQIQQFVMKAPENQTDSLELYTLFWPWRPSIEALQKRILVDRNELTNINFKFLECSMKNAPHGVAYSFHSALNRLRDLDPSLKIKHTRGHHSILSRHTELSHPTLHEITIQSVYQNGINNICAIAEQSFLKRARKYINDCYAISDSRLYKISSAPFFMLCIPQNFTKRDLLSEDIKARRPQVVLMDLTSVYNYIGKSWQKVVSDFLWGLNAAFSEHEKGTPPVFAITEDPIVFNTISYQLLSYYEEKRFRKKVSRSSLFNLSQDLFDDRNIVEGLSNTPKVMVASYAESMVGLFSIGQDLRNKMKDLGSDELAEQIDILNQTVRNLLNMPGGLDDYTVFLEEYCNETGHDYKAIAIRPLENWIKAEELVLSGDAGAERIEVDNFLKSSLDIMEGLKNSTPLKSLLEILYDKQFEIAARPHALIFPNKQMKAFAEWMLSHRGNDIVMDDFKLVFLDSREAIDLAEQLPTSFEQIYLILPRQKYLSRLLAQKEMPSALSFVCDGGTVLSLLRYINTLSKIPGLEIIRTRLNAIREALQQAADNHFPVRGELDEVEMIVNTLMYNIRESEPGSYHGHPVIIVTDEGVDISAYEGSEILQYREDNELQPFSKSTVSQLQSGDKFFVITPAFLDSASDKINITAMASDSLRAYHLSIVQRTSNLGTHSLKRRAEIIQQKMKADADSSDIGEGENLGNIIRWINVEKLLEIPRELVKPQAPKVRRVFKLFMNALDASEAEIDWYWSAAIQSTRKARIRAGLDRNRIFYKLLLDPSSVAQYFHSDPRDLRKLIDIACGCVFTVSHIVKEHQDADSED